MSTASVSRTIKFISKSGTYTAQIMSPSGDLYQEYDESGKAYPDFKTEPADLQFICTSSRAIEGIVTPMHVDYFIGNEQIKFSESGESIGQPYSGYFQEIKPSDGNPYYTLRIKNNLVAVNNAAPVTIRMVALVGNSENNDKIQASYTIPIQRISSTGYRVTISAGTKNGFILNSDQNIGGVPAKTCTLVANVLQNGETVQDSSFLYTWSKMGTLNWEDISGETGSSIIVDRDDVNVYGEFKVEVTKAGRQIGTDTQMVLDSSDPLVIEPHPNPEDESISEDESGNGQVTYTPVVVSRQTGKAALETLFYFVKKSASGKLLKSNQSSPSSSVSVTRADCIDAKGDVSLTITSVK